jgi:heat shock protein HtpX
LASALTKIKNFTPSPAKGPVKNVNQVTAPMYFSNPFKKSSISNLFSTHPPIDERIKRLQNMY